MCPGSDLSIVPRYETNWSAVIGEFRSSLALRDGHLFPRGVAGTTGLIETKGTA